MLRWPVLASDLDGTLAVVGRVPPSARAALQRYRDAGGTVVLVTGRRQIDLVQHFAETLAVVDLVVAENGAVLEGQDGGAPVLVAPSPPADLPQLLAEHGVVDLEVGSVIVASDREDEYTFQRVAKELAGVWDCHVIPNKDRVMLVPAGVDKGSGLAHALERLGRTADEVVAVGDADNDVPLLRAAGLAVAVANAEPDLIAVSDVVTAEPSAEGVVELVNLLLSEEGPLLPR